MTKRIVWAITLVVIATLLIVGACASKNPNFNAARNHHTADGFRNLHAEKHPGGFWKWKRDQWREGLPKKPAGGYKFPLLKPDTTYLAANRSESTLTWIGHATLLVQIKGVNILTDPHFSERASPVDFAGPKRVVPAAMTIGELPPIDLVVISHNHYDHLDAASVIQLNKRANGKTLFLVPLGIKKWFTARKIDNVVEMDWWDERSELGLNIAFTPMQHWSKRTLWDTNQALWGGWLFRAENFKFIFIADSGYSKDFAEIFLRYGAMDFAAVPIGHYEPRWFMKMQHANPPEALQMVRDLHAAKAIAVHWGTFDDLTDESLYDPPQILNQALSAAELPSEKLAVMTHGETRKLAAH
jgi:N-acyl-phosphatidylethanolamine-hydrolysing phospholipase D